MAVNFYQGIVTIKINKKTGEKIDEMIQDDTRQEWIQTRFRMVSNNNMQMSQLNRNRHSNCSFGACALKLVILYFNHHVPLFFATNNNAIGHAGLRA